MRKLIFSLVLTFSGPVLAGHVIGNGGGGIVTGNGVTTIHASGLETLIPMKEVPGLAYLARELDQFDVRGSQKKFFFESFVKSSKRRFYQLPTSQVNPADLLELKKIYAEYLNVEVSKVAIFALTDQETKNTYLLDDFFRLSERQQAVLLFHEGLWVFSSQFDLARVIELERKFEEITLTRSNRLRFELVLTLGQEVGFPFAAMGLAFQDLEQRDLLSVFPAEFFSCLAENAFMGISKSVICERVWRDWISSEETAREPFLLTLMRETKLPTFWFSLVGIQKVSAESLTNCLIESAKPVANRYDLTVSCLQERWVLQLPLTDL